MKAPGGEPWDRSVWLAFRATFSAHRRWKVWPPYTMHGVRVTEARTHRPWGRSAHRHGYLSHAAARVVLAWRGGQYVGAAVKWRCGAETRWFFLEEEPSGPICPLCTIQRPGRGR